MTGKSKVLGLLLTVVLSMGAMGAMTALSAGSDHVPAKFTFEQQTVTFKGTQILGGLTFTFSGLEVNCAVTTFHSQQTGVAGGGTWERESITLTPTYKECETGGKAVAVVLNGCDYVIHASGKVDIVCPPESDITIGAVNCTVHVPPQTGMGTVEFLTDTLSGGKHDLILDVNIEKIKYTQTDGFLCPFGGTTEETDGHYHGAATLEAIDPDSEAKRHLTHDPTQA